MQMKIRRWLSLLLVLCIGFVLSGCGNEKKVDNSDILGVGVPSLSGTFTPLYVTSIYDSYVTDLIYDSLLSRDEQGNRVASLATALPEISEDYKTYTFHLKQGIKFSNGEKLSADDVAFTFRLLADPAYDGPYDNIVRNLVGFDEYVNKQSDTFSGIEVIDNDTITFHFKEGYRSNIDALASLGIMCKQSFPDYQKGDLETIKKQGNKAVGSGPYVLKEYTDYGAVLVKNKQYDRGGYEIAKINIKTVNDATSMLELEKGNIDLLSGVDSPALISDASNHNDVLLNQYENAGITWLTLNCESGATADREVRKALTLAFDREQFVNQYFACEDCANYLSLAYVPQIFQNPASLLKPYVTNEEQLDTLEEDHYNIKQAKKVLKEAGWLVGKDGYRYKDKQKLTIKVMVSEEQEIADTLIAMWKKDWQAIGVDLKITNVDFHTMISEATNDKKIDEWHAFVLSSVFSSDDLDSIYTLFHSSSAENNGRNLARYRNAELDALLDEGRFSFDETNLEQLYLQIATIIHNEYVNVPIYATQKFDIYNKRVKNFKTSSYYPWTKAMKDAKLK
ncbi:MAG: ABC transporter substrate-binding protein [Erysipelotrichia bacterium]|nr:ABC transporter substrate-binding protein [Erysipelotrichia bacterium]NCC55003.1 ABC transporter substrate-binding protein [Erysipelotrichia bacterium]